MLGVARQEADTQARSTLHLPIILHCYQQDNMSMSYCQLCFRNSWRAVLHGFQGKHVTACFYWLMPVLQPLYCFSSTLLQQSMGRLLVQTLQCMGRE
jgi:Tat protein secretion system quality control protein TatD with DNase activity